MIISASADKCAFLSPQRNTFEDYLANFNALQAVIIAFFFEKFRDFLSKELNATAHGIGCVWIQNREDKILTYLKRYLNRKDVDDVQPILASFRWLHLLA
jgi:hypothetical protein